MDNLTHSLAGRLLAPFSAFCLLAFAAANGVASDQAEAEPTYSVVVGTPMGVEYAGEDPRCSGGDDRICLSSLVSSDFTEARTLAGPDVGPEPEIMYTMGGQRIRLPNMLMVVRHQSDGTLFAVEWDYIFSKRVCLRTEWFGQRCWDVE